MFLLTKLFDLRGGGGAEDEKPFLEHLEDLRSTIIKILLTLIIGFSLCFGFRNNLMELMRAPIDGVWQLQLEKSLYGLPKKVSAGTWERATKAASDGNELSESQQQHFYSSLADGDLDFPFHVEAVKYYRTVIAVKGLKKQKAYIEAIPDISPEMKEQLVGLAESFDANKGLAPDPDSNSRKRTVFMQSLNPTEGFMLSFKLAMYAGIAVTFPFLLFFILQFILPGLHKNERKALWPALAIGFGLFLTGVFFSYLVVLPRVLEFFSTFSGEMGISNDWRIGEYISFATQFVLIFGVAFELPVVVMTLVVLGVMEYQIMAKSRAYAVIGILVIAAVITPTPDIMTLGLLAGPMYLLYELCIVLAWFVERKRRKQDAIELAAEKERVQKLLAEIEAEDEIVHQQYEADEWDHDHYHEGMEDDHGALEEHEEHDSAPVIAAPMGQVAHETDFADLEGEERALDPEAEAREAGEPEEDSDKSSS